MPNVITRGGILNIVTPTPFTSPIRNVAADHADESKRQICVLMPHDVAGEERSERHDAANREVDSFLSAENDQVLSGGGDSEKGGDQKLVDDLARRSKSGRQRLSDRQQQRDRDHLDRQRTLKERLRLCEHVVTSSGAPSQRRPKERPE